MNSNVITLDVVDWFPILFFASIIILVVIFALSFWFRALKKGMGYYILLISAILSALVFLGVFTVYLSIYYFGTDPEGGMILIGLPFITLIIFIIFLLGLVLNIFPKKTNTSNSSWNDRF